MKKIIHDALIFLNKSFFITRITDFTIILHEVKPFIFKKHQTNLIKLKRYTNADFKISLYVCVYIKIIP